MIKDEEDLATTQAYADSIVGSLAELRRKLLVDHPDRYLLLAQRPLEELSLVREEIDTYLRLEAERQADLSISMKGITLGTAPLGVVMGPIEAIRRGIQTLAGMIAGVEPGHVGRFVKRVEQLSELQLAGVGGSSVRLDLNLPASSQLGLIPLEDLGGRAVELFVRVATWAAGDEEPEVLLGALGNVKPALAAWQVLKALPPKRSPVTRIVLSGRMAEKPIVVDGKTRLRLQLLIRTGQVVRRTTEIGDIRSLDLDAAVFVLRKRPNEAKPLRCLFQPMFLEREVLAAVGRRVEVNGELLIDPITDTEKEFLVDSITKTNPPKSRGRV